jgi:broad specificity phosphatase PhoE
MREIYFIRHGEGYHNLFNYELNNYHLQFPRLTVVGLKQCFLLRDELKNIKFDRIIVSPLRRTLETAENVFSKDNRFVSMESIREFVSNPCDFRERVEDISKEYDYVDFGLVDDKYEHNNKEEDIDINIRIDSFFSYLTNSNYEKIAVVSHGEFLKRFFKRHGNKLNINNTSFLNNCELVIGYLK